MKPEKARGPLSPSIINENLQPFEDHVKHFLQSWLSEENPPAVLNANLLPFYKQLPGFYDFWRLLFESRLMVTTRREGTKGPFSLCYFKVLFEVEAIAQTE